MAVVPMAVRPRLLPGGGRSVLSPTTYSLVTLEEMIGNVLHLWHSVILISILSDTGVQLPRPCMSPSVPPEGSKAGTYGVDVSALQILAGCTLGHARWQARGEDFRDLF